MAAAETAWMAWPVGVVGAGAMGLAMAQRLRALGWPVSVHDIDPARERLAAEAGCTVAASAAALVEACRTLIVAVVDADQVRQVMAGPQGAGAVLHAGQQVLLCPTIAPQDVEALSAPLLRAGVAVLDAPMSGGPERARRGEMSLMVAGEPGTVADLQPLLQALASRLFVVSPRLGDGARTKLVNNLLAAAHLAAAGEAFALARAMGLDLATTAAVIGQSSGQSWIAQDRWARRQAGDPAVQARTALLAKDSALALASARAAGLALPLGEQAAAAFARAVAQGAGDADDAQLLG